MKQWEWILFAALLQQSSYWRVASYVIAEESEREDASLYSGRKGLGGVGSSTTNDERGRWNWELQSSRQLSAMILVLKHFLQTSASSHIFFPMPRIMFHNCTTPRTLFFQSIDSIGIAGIISLQPAGRQVPPPSRHPGAARRSRRLHRNGRKLRSYHLYRNMERVGGEKHERRQSPNPSRNEGRKENEKEKCGWAWPWKNPPCRTLTDRRSVGVSYPCCRRATLPPLLSPSSHHRATPPRAASQRKPKRQ